jgi:hypothetical protein
VASLRTQADYDVELLLGGDILRSDVPQVELGKEAATVRGRVLHWLRRRSIVEEGTWTLDYRRDGHKWVVRKRAFEVEEVHAAPPPILIAIEQWRGGFAIVVNRERVVAAPDQPAEVVFAAFARETGALLDRWWEEARVPRAIVPVETILCLDAPYGLSLGVSLELERLGVPGFEFSWQ